MNRSTVDLALLLPCAGRCSDGPTAHLLGAVDGRVGVGCWHCGSTRELSGSETRDLARRVAALFRALLGHEAAAVAS